jgi:hypothetical protein
MMNRTRRGVIDQLVEELGSGRKRWAGTRLALLWLISSTVLVTLITLAAGPFRPGAGEELLSVPRFLMEMVLGVVAIVSIGAVAIKSAVPAGSDTRLSRFAIVVTALWLLNYVVGLRFPTMELGTLGKRPYCVWETLLYALPTMAIGFTVVRKGYVLNWTVTGLTIGLVAGFIPGYLMEMACMYDAQHILIYHISPAFLTGALGALTGRVAERWPHTS